MNNINLSQTNYGKKILFSEILSVELCDCKYRIDAVFEWVPHNQIFSISLRKDGLMHLAINLNSKEDSLFGCGTNAVALSILYRAYFIANYIRAIESANDACPNSYFAGLLTLGVINNVCSCDKIKGYTPTSLSTRTSLKPIDFQCAIQAVARLLLEHPKGFSQKERAKCQQFINMLIDYSSLPEIAYLNSSYPVYSSIVELKRLQQTVSTVPTAIEKFALLKQCDDLVGQEITVESLLCLYQKTGNVLWLGLYMRTLAMAGDKYVPANRLVNDKLQDCIMQYRKDSLLYYTAHSNTQQKLLKDNLLAIIFLSEKINRICPNNDCPGSGLIHYY